MLSRRSLLLLLSLAALALPAQAQAQSSTYHPASAARDFANGPGGWTSGFFSGGPCLVALLCPTVSNGYVGSGGANGQSDGFLRAEFGGLLGVGGEVNSVYRSPPFIYKGAAGLEPQSVQLNLDRRARVNALLSVTEGAAEYSVELIDRTAGGAGVLVAGPATLEGATRWTSVPTIEVDPGQLTRGHEYFLRIVTRLQFGVEVSPGSRADYDNIVLTAEGSADGGDGDACVLELSGSPGDDSLGGSPGGDLIKALGGNDELFGVGGDDCLFGGPGDDRAFGGTGSDELHGNAGGDELGGGTGADSLSGGASADQLRGGSGADTLRGGVGDDTLRGGGRSDQLRGNSGNDDLRGGGGGDRMIGGANDDVLRGLAGNDEITGGSGSDVVRAGGGNDEIRPGAGRDRVDAGKGNDRVDVRGGGRDKVSCGPGRDRVEADRRDKVGGSCERVKLRG